MSKRINLRINDNSRPNLISLFKDYVRRKVSESRKSSYSGRYSYDYYDDEYDYDMMQLLRMYGEYSPNSCFMGEDDDDYYVDEDGVIVFPISDKDGEKTKHPGEYRRSADDMDEYWDKMSKFNERGKRKHTKHRGSRGSKGAKVIDINQPYDANYIDESGDALSDCIIYYYPDYHDKYSRIEFNNLAEFDEYCSANDYYVPPYAAEYIAYSPISHCCLNPIARERGVLEIMREETYGDMFYEACETSELSNT